MNLFQKKIFTGRRECSKYIRYHDAETDYILEIEMPYCKLLQRSHNNWYPMAADRIKETTDMLSPH